MARFELGDAWIGVHADTTSVDNEVRNAANRASRSNKVKLDVDIDSDGLRRGGSKLASAASSVAKEASARIASTLGNGFEAIGSLGQKVFQGLTSAAAQAATSIGSALSSSVMAGGASGGVTVLIQGLTTLASVAAVAAAAIVALAPALQVAAGGFGVAMGAALAFGSVLATLKLGFSGAMEALEAYGAAQDSAGESSKDLAKQTRSNATAIRNAQQTISDARRNAAESFKRSQKQIADAEKALARAREDAADRVEDAEERVQRANEDALEAQEKLNEERKDAVERIKDLADAARNAALSEERAQLKLAEAKHKLEVIESHLRLGTGEYDEMDRQKALLDIKEATLDLTEAQEDNAKAQEKAKIATEKGVEGDKQVVEAKKRAAEAAKKQGEAQQDLTKTQQRSAESVTEAEERVKEAKEQGAKAQADANRNIERAAQALEDLKVQQQETTQSQKQGNAALDKYNEAMANLTPAGRAFVEQLISMKDGLDTLKKTAEANLLPGVTSFLKDAARLFPIINQHVGNVASSIGDMFERLGDYIGGGTFKGQLSNILGSVEKFITSVGKVITTTFPALVTITEAAAPLLESLGKWLEKVATKFADWIEDARKSGELKKFFEGVKTTFEKLETTGGLVFEIIGKIVKMLFPTSQKASGGVLDGINSALQSISDLLDPLSAVAKTLSEKLNPAFEKLKKLIVDQILPDLKNAFIPIWEKLKTSYDQVNLALKDGNKEWGTLWTWIVKAADFFRDRLYPILSAVARFIIDVFVSHLIAFIEATKKVIEWIGKLWDKLKKFWEDTKQFWAGFKKGFGDTWDWIRSKTETTWNKIKDIATAVKNHVVGVFNSIAGALAGPLNKVINVINAAIGKINAILPSSLDLKLIGNIPTASMGRYATGGRITGPGTGTSDQVPILASNGEYVIRAAAARKLGTPLLDSLNRADTARVDYSGDMGSVEFKRGRFAKGGLVQAVKNWLPSVDPKPYVFGAVGPYAYDCSGITGEVFNRLTGKPSFTRRFVTTSNFSALGFKRGRGTYTMGVNTAHMVGNLDGMPFEAGSPARGIMVGSGSGAQSVNAFPDQWYLPQVGDQFVSGGGQSTMGGVGEALKGQQQSILAALLNQKGSGGFGNAPTWLGALAAGGLAGRIKQIVESLAGSYTNWTGGVASKAQVTSWIKAAMEATGISGNGWIDGMLTLTKRESNWNPKAINNWDSNAAAGIPSKGIAQVIDPTFAAYRSTALPNDIWNPIANIGASMRYINGRYGGIGNVQQANPNLPPKGYRNGGILQPGDMGFNETTKPEYVFTAEQLGMLTKLAEGSNSYNINIMIDPTKIKTIEDLTSLVNGLSTSARRYGAGPNVRF